MIAPELQIKAAANVGLIKALQPFCHVALRTHENLRVKLNITNM